MSPPRDYRFESNRHDGDEETKNKHETIPDDDDTFCSSSARVICIGCKQNFTSDMPRDQSTLENLSPDHA